MPEFTIMPVVEEASSETRKEVLRRYNREYARKYRKKNHEKRLTIERRYKANHPDAGKLDYNKNKSAYLVRASKRYKSNREAILEYTTARAQRILALVSELKAKVGCKCGEHNPVCLDFHHRDRTTKEFSIASCHTEKRVMVEVEKCDVVCANCHRKHHWNEIGGHVSSKYTSSQLKCYEAYIDITSQIKLEEGCKTCGTHDIVVLEFHHRNQEEKTYDIAKMKLYRADKIVAELVKCDVYCANCHRKHHAALKVEAKTA